MNKAYNYCIYLLSRQDYSEFKLRQKLRMKKEFLPIEIDETLESLKTRGLLNEENYRRLFIRKWMMKGESEDKIRNRGAQEKLQFEPQEFAAVTEELDISDEDNIEKLVAKKLRAKIIPQDNQEKYKLRDKVLRYLISKGHGYEDSKRSIDQYLAQASN
jgi:regulatory protein